MVGVGSSFFFQLPSKSAKRTLHPAKVAGLIEDVYTAEAEENDLPVEEGQDFLIYFEKGREFMQQSAHIECIEETEPELLFSFKALGKPVSAEGRQHYRVSTVMLELDASFGDETSCSVLDVSPTGFALIANEHHGIGFVLDTEIAYGSEKYGGNVCIQSVTKLDSKRIRYGVHCVEGRNARGTLADGLHKLSAKIQREQLQRLAGTA